MRTHPGLHAGTFGRRPASPLQIEFLETLEAVGPLSAFTFTGAALGVADPNRKIYVVVHLGLGSVVEVTGVTVAGIAAALYVHAGMISASSSYRYTAILAADVPSGTTGDIIVNLSGSAGECIIATYRVINQTSGAAAASSIIESPADNVSLTLDVPTDGGVIAGFCFTGSSSTTAWAGVNETYDQLLTGNNAVTYSGASAISQTKQALVITATGATTATAAVALAAVAFF